MIYDLRPFIEWIVADYESSLRVDSTAGAYGRRPGDTKVELYGVADMACVLHTIGRLHPTPEKRAEWGAVFDSFQDPLSGAYAENGKPTHVREHCTAFALGAMELLGLSPHNRLNFVDSLRSTDALRVELAGLDWTEHVYLDSHRGAGLGSIFALQPSLRSATWFAAYFGFLDAKIDPANGMLGDGKPKKGDTDQIGGTFHYLFLYEHFNRRLAHPEARIDAIVGLQEDAGTWDEHNPLWLTLDAVYLLTRSARHTTRRRGKVEAAVRLATDWMAGEVLDADARDQHFVEAQLGAHNLTAAVSALAEVQQFLGIDQLQTDLPLHLVLDRRPFI
jgi:hypothetical protein